MAESEAANKTEDEKNDSHESNDEIDKPSKNSKEDNLENGSKAFEIESNKSIEKESVEDGSSTRQSKDKEIEEEHSDNKDLDENPEHCINKELSENHKNYEDNKELSENPEYNINKELCENQEQNINKELSENHVITVELAVNQNAKESPEIVVEPKVLERHINQRHIRHNAVRYCAKSTFLDKQSTSKPELEPVVNRAHHHIPVEKTKTFPETFKPEPTSEACHCFYILKYIVLYISFTAIIAGYAAGGAILFSNLEKNREIEYNAKIDKWKNDTAVLLATELRQVRPHESLWARKVFQYLEIYEKDLLKASAIGYRRFDDDDREQRWTITSSLLFSVSLMTTTGYGSMTPRSKLGRTATALYSLFGIPLAFCWFMTTGHCLAIGLTTVFRQVCCNLCSDNADSKRNNNSFKSYKKGFPKSKKIRSNSIAPLEEHNPTGKFPQILQSHNSKKFRHKGLLLPSETTLEEQYLIAKTSRNSYQEDSDKARPALQISPTTLGEQNLTVKTSGMSSLQNARKNKEVLHVPSVSKLSSDKFTIQSVSENKGIIDICRNEFCTIARVYLEDNLYEQLNMPRTIDIAMTIVYSMLFFVIYFTFCSIAFALREGWQLTDIFYFNFLMFVTIGPGCHELEKDSSEIKLKSSPCYLMFLILGYCILSMIVNLLYLLVRRKCCTHEEKLKVKALHALNQTFSSVGP